jgi:hypothetical protein
MEKRNSFSQLKGISNHNYRVVNVINAKVDGKIIIVHQLHKGLKTEEAVKKEIKDKKIKLRKNGVLAIEFLASASPYFFRPDDPEKYGEYDIKRVKIFNTRLKEWLEKNSMAK